MGADPCSRSNDGTVPIHLAAAQGHDTALRLLVQHGANIEEDDNSGRTARSITKERGHGHLESTFLDLTKEISSPDISKFETIMNEEGVLNEQEKGMDTESENKNEDKQKDEH